MRAGNVAKAKLHDVFYRPMYVILVRYRFVKVNKPVGVSAFHARRLRSHCCTRILNKYQYVQFRNNGRRRLCRVADIWPIGPKRFLPNNFATRDVTHKCMPSNWIFYMPLLGVFYISLLEENNTVRDYIVTKTIFKIFFVIFLNNYRHNYVTTVSKFNKNWLHVNSTTSAKRLSRR